MSDANGAPPEFAGFWAARRAGGLAFPRCTNCGRTHWYPKKLCPFCLSDQLTWQPVSGHGTIHSWTVVRRAFEPKLADRVPYVVALVEFADAPGVRLVTEIRDDDAEPGSHLRGGLDVELCPADPLEDPPLPRFRPAGTGA